MARSRLSRRMEQKTKKNLLLSILGIILVIMLTFKFGIPLLVNFSLFLDGTKRTQEQSKNEDPSFIAPPVLNPLPQATASATIIISGIASKDQTIKLYINDDLTNETQTREDGNFSFKETVKSGENTIRVKAVVGKKESEFSKPLTTVFKIAPPSLNVSAPIDGQSFSKDQNTVNVNGTTDIDVKITVNGFWAITENDGSFSYSLPLKNGENKIKIAARDLAGNTTEKEIGITYSQ